jgi:hypothetical protein
MVLNITIRNWYFWRLISRKQFFLKPLKYLLLSITFIFLLVTGMQSCKKDVLNIDGNFKLSFSADTVYFDTVFVTLGSTTQRFKVYNNSNQRVKISAIRLASGANSFFRMNVDGIPGTQISDLEIGANDSIFVFAEVTIDPNNETNPFVVEDSILFETNGNMQKVKLLAYGRNADFYRPTEFPTNGLPAYSVLQCGTIWTKEKPKVIIGYLVVDTCSLQIEAGTQVYMYNNSGLWIFPGGTLNVNGTLQDSVVFKGVRKEEEYEESPGQWDRIWINQGSTGNTINYAVIKNGNIGIQAELITEFDPTTERKLVVSNTRIRNMRTYGLYANNYNLEASNCLVSNCGSYALLAAGGGTYNFRHCTFANYWNETVRTEPVCAISNFLETNTAIQVADMNFSFTNGIIYGNITNGNELIALGRPEALFNWNFSNTLLKIDNPDIDLNNTANFTNVFVNEDPLFKDYTNQDYRLQVSSPAKDRGNLSFVYQIPSIPNDILGNSRIADSAPDLGTFEFIP